MKFPQLWKFVLLGVFLAALLFTCVKAQTPQPLSPALDDTYWANWNCHADNRADRTAWHYCENANVILGFWNEDLVTAELDFPQLKAGDAVTRWGDPRFAHYTPGGRIHSWASRPI